MAPDAKPGFHVAGTISIPCDVHFRPPASSRHFQCRPPLRSRFTANHTQEAFGPPSSQRTFPRAAAVAGRAAAASLSASLYGHEAPGKSYAFSGIPARVCRHRLYRLSITYAEKKSISPFPLSPPNPPLPLAGPKYPWLRHQRQSQTRTAGGMSLADPHSDSIHPNSADGEFIRRGWHPRRARDLDKQRRRYYRLSHAGAKWRAPSPTGGQPVARLARSRKILRGDYV